VIRHANPRLAAPLLAAAAALLAPQAGWAGTTPSGGSGGVSLVGSPGSAAPSPNPLVHPGNATVSASGNGMSVQTTVSGLLQHRLRFTGTVPAGDAGDVVEIQRSGRQTGNTWANTAHATVNPSGTFTVVWRANHIGRFAIQAELLPASEATAASATTAGPTPPAPSAVSPALTITVYRPSLATLYGPGFFGNRTACGQRLRRATLGVASRTLRCGTPVAVYYGGHTMVVPVIDRGPFANGADWDLTTATATALGITGTATIGAVSLQPGATT
jgi:hypothetical protein